MLSSPERLARLEAIVEHIDTKVDKISAKQDEIYDTIISARATAKAATTGLALIRHAYPPISAIIAALVAVKYGLPRI